MPEQWFWCWITEAEERVEPDWSKVPEARRATVRQQWANAALTVRKRWKLWGPQIAFFQRHYTVEVEGLIDA